MTTLNLCWLVATFALTVMISLANAQWLPYGVDLQCPHCKILPWKLNEWNGYCFSKGLTKIPECVTNSFLNFHELYVLLSLGFKGLYPNR